MFDTFSTQKILAKKCGFIQQVSFSTCFFLTYLNVWPFIFNVMLFMEHQYIVHFMKHQTGTTIEQFNGIPRDPVFSLFWQEISACAAVHTCYVIDACNRVPYIILLPPMIGTSFVLVALTRLILSELKHWVTWSHQTGKNFQFLRGEKNLILCFCLTIPFLIHFYLWCKLHLKNQNFLFAFKTFFEETKRFMCYQICSLMRNLDGKRNIFVLNWRCF